MRAFIRGVIKRGRCSIFLIITLLGKRLFIKRGGIYIYSNLFLLLGGVAFIRENGERLSQNNLSWAHRNLFDIINNYTHIIYHKIQILIKQVYTGWASKSRIPLRVGIQLFLYHLYIYCIYISKNKLYKSYCKDFLNFVAHPVTYVYIFQKNLK